MAKGDGAMRRAGAKELREEMDEDEEKRFQKKEKKKLWFGYIQPLHLFFLLLFTLPTAFTVADYFFNFSKVEGGGYGALDPAQAVWRERLKAFYGENNPGVPNLRPGKLDEIPALLRKYKGKENKLWRKLNTKYERKDED